VLSTIEADAADRALPSQRHRRTNDSPYRYSEDYADADADADADAGSVAPHSG